MQERRRATRDRNTTRTMFDVAFPSTVAAGTKVFITAFWYNPRALRGPAATPISAFVQYGALAA